MLMADYPYRKQEGANVVKLWGFRYSEEPEFEHKHNTWFQKSSINEVTNNETNLSVAAAWIPIDLHEMMIILLRCFYGDQLRDL